MRFYLPEFLDIEYVLEHYLETHFVTPHWLSTRPSTQIPLMAVRF